MANMRMVTRTVKLTNCETMCVRVSTKQVENSSLVLTGYFENATDALKELKKAYETEDFKIVNITAITYDEILYGMPEQKFIELAEILPPRKDYTK